MDFGISTACFYPLETEKALLETAKMGVRKTEVFFNAPMELEKSFLDKVVRIQDDYGVDIASVHPFTSGCEPFFLFSEYKRRFYDMLEFYKNYMQACNIVGAKILVIHGMRTKRAISDEEYFERFYELYNLGRQFGVTVAQENVFDHAAGNADFLRKMKHYLKDDFKMVFDVKQMHRCGLAFDDFYDLFENFVHIHISDSDKGNTCLPPGEGNYNLSALLQNLKDMSYNGSCIIELYRNNYIDYFQLQKSYNYLLNCAKNLK